MERNVFCEDLAEYGGWKATYRVYESVVGVIEVLVCLLFHLEATYEFEHVLDFNIDSLKDSHGILKSRICRMDILPVRFTVEHGLDGGFGEQRELGFSQSIWTHGKPSDWRPSSLPRRYFAVIESCVANRGLCRSMRDHPRQKRAKMSPRCCGEPQLR